MASFLKQPYMCARFGPDMSKEARGVPPDRLGIDTRSMRPLNMSWLSIHVISDSLTQRLAIDARAQILIFVQLALASSQHEEPYLPCVCSQLLIVNDGMSYLESEI